MGRIAKAETPQVEKMEGFEGRYAEIDDYTVGFETRRVSQDMNALLDQLVERKPMQDHDGKSGALLEHARLADGTRVVIKWLDRAADLVMQATGDEAGREYVLWRDGVFDRLPTGIGHAVLDAATSSRRGRPGHAGRLRVDHRMEPSTQSCRVPAGPRRRGASAWRVRR